MEPAVQVLCVRGCRSAGIGRGRGGAGDAAEAEAEYLDLVALEWDEGEALAENGGDEEKLDGCAAYDVGWMRVALDDFVPRTYMLLGESPFMELYERPPVVVRL